MSSIGIPPPPFPHPTSMKCPHCPVTFHDAPNRRVLDRDTDGVWLLEGRVCPQCGKSIYVMVCVPTVMGQDYNEKDVLEKYLVRPKGITRQPLPQGVPSEIVADYNEAAVVLADSPKASAALSRRCLQHALRTIVKVTPADLSKEIDDVIALGVLPSYIADELDQVRTIGNFAAHPNKSTATGVILDVEPGEAEWNLEVLDHLFDFYFVRLEKSAQLKADINKKLVAAGKSPLP